MSAGSKRRYPLAKMYGRMSGWEADKLTEEQLKRKQQLCEEVTFKIFETHTR